MDGELYGCMSGYRLGLMLELMLAEMRAGHREGSWHCWDWPEIRHIHWFRSHLTLIYVICSLFISLSFVIQMAVAVRLAMILIRH